MLEVTGITGNWTGPKHNRMINKKRLEYSLFLLISSSSDSVKNSNLFSNNILETFRLLKICYSTFLKK